MVQVRRRKLKRLCTLLITLCLLPVLVACRAETPVGVSVLLDGGAWQGGSVSADSEDDLRVYITLDGDALVDLPFGEAHRVTITQPDGGENTVVLTGEAVYMESANCHNQDCVNMGEVTRENHELRVLGGFIICLPHRVSVEVRGA